MKLPGHGLTWKEFLGDLKEEWLRDNVGNVAGAVTFFAVLALFPFLLFLASLAAVLLDPQIVPSIVDDLGQVAPAAVTQIVGERIHSLSVSKSYSVLTFSALVALFSASGGMLALMDALNTIYGVRDSRSYFKRRGLALVMTLVTAALVLIAGLAAVALPPVAKAIGGQVGNAVIWLRLPVAGLVMMFTWALLYWKLPDVEQEFKFITPGSVIGVLAWVVASWGFSQYVTHFGSYEVTYGALGGVVIMLFWMWISAQVLLLGAEVNAIIEHRSPEGKRAGAKKLSDKGETGTKSEEHEKRMEQLRYRAAHPKVEFPPPLVKRVAQLGLAAFVFRLLRRKEA